jgi:hypothetical protein
MAQFELGSLVNPHAPGSVVYIYWITAPPLAFIGDCESGNARALYLTKTRDKTVKDYQASIRKLRADEAEAALIRDLATDPAKRELYDKLCKHFSNLANEVEQVINSRRVE